jgi:hypothetical protein
MIQQEEKMKACNNINKRTITGVGQISYMKNRNKVEKVLFHSFQDEQSRVRVGT